MTACIVLSDNIADDNIVWIGLRMSSHANYATRSFRMLLTLFREWYKRSDISWSEMFSIQLNALIHCMLTNKTLPRIFMFACEESDTYQIMSDFEKLFVEYEVIDDSQLKSCVYHIMQSLIRIMATQNWEHKLFAKSDVTLTEYDIELQDNILDGDNISFAEAVYIHNKFLWGNRI